jgi:P-type Ca2+ transporter type 2C
MTDGLPALALAFDRTPGVMQQKPRPPSSPLLDAPARRFVMGVAIMKALIALALLWLVPRLGYDTDATRATAFHFMAIGQLVLTYPARRTWMRPLRNGYLHAAVLAGVVVQIAAAWFPLSSELLGRVRLPLELWGLVALASLLSWGWAHGVSQVVWTARTAPRGALT